MNRELPDVQAGFRKDKRTRDQITNICWIIEKARDFQQNICFCFFDYANVFDCVDHNKLENSQRDKNTKPAYLITENLYAGQEEATVRTEHGTVDCFQIGKELSQGCILLLCLFTCFIYLYTEYIMQNVGMDEAQAGIKISWRNINNLRYADDTTLMALNAPLNPIFLCPS